MLKMRACKENRMEPLMEITTQKLVNWTWRWALLALGMFVAASGIACVAQAQLGTTPISSTPYVLADIMGLTFGETTFIVNVVFVFLQWVMLRKLSSDMISDPLNDRKIDPPAKGWLGVVFAAGSGLRL